MAGTSLLALLDDIASVLDDIALMTKIAAKKTAGVLGDDLALNAEQVSGVRAERELPVVWAVAKGSLRNKSILVPLALLLSAVAPWAVSPLLMVGGIYLCFEGFEKVIHSWQKKCHHPKNEADTMPSPAGHVDLKTYERDKIKGAIRTDFILSAEIIIIALGTVQGESFINQLLVVSGIAVMMTIGVYALVAGIVKLDDIGLLLTADSSPSSTSKLKQTAGHFLVRLAPYMMKILSIVGTFAMFMVGGGILLHGLPYSHHFTQLFHDTQSHLFSALISSLTNTIIGIICGAIAMGIVTTIKSFNTTKGS